MNKKDEDVSDVKREGWKAKEIAEEGLYQESDEATRQILRGDATKGDPDEKDIAGGPKPEDTDYGRKQKK